MLNHKRIERALSEAEQSFKDCWLKLTTIRKGEREKSEMVNAVISFQPTLGIALFKLESLYIGVCKEGRELVRRRSELNAKWFRRRIHTINGYKRLLQDTVDRQSNGDSFAWIFYQHDRELLRKH